MLVGNQNSIVIKTIIGSLAFFFAAASIAQTPTFELGMQALQDKAKNTDVIISVKPINGATPPTVLKQVQMKSFDTAGTLRWTKNQSGVAATVTAGPPATATSILSYTDMLRNQPVQAQVLLQTAETVKTEVYRDKIAVQLRPDLTIATLTTPAATVHVNDVVRITALVKELNGDLGATANLSLKNGTTEIDKVTGVVVKKLGSTFVVFATRFDNPGIYNLTSTITSSNPSDYDTSNNSNSITIEVKNNALDSYYYLYNNYEKYNFNYTYREFDGFTNYILNGVQEFGSMTVIGLNPPTPLAFPLKVETSFAVDNGAPKISQTTIFDNLTYSYVLSGCNVYSGAVKSINNSVDIYVQHRDYCGSKTNYAEVFHYAADYIYYSEYHDKYYNIYISRGQDSRGIVLNPQFSVQAKVYVTDNNGITFGGSGETMVQQYVQELNFPNPNYPNFISGYIHTNSMQGSSSGTATP